jgi:Tol biopolymer transport system component/serine/threonine protein kinase
MTSARWERIAEIYASVVSSSQTSRRAMLDEACAGDAELRGEVESLLTAREDAGNFLSPSHLRSHILGLVETNIAAGRTFGRYEIVSVLGAGGMGEVYLARDTLLHRQVALKVLPARFMRDADRVARFRREAKAASALSHPNIVTIYDIGETGGTWFIAAEFIDGTTLRMRLVSRRIEIPEAIHIATQCASALTAAHEAGILHRDIKPENIMLGRDGGVKLVDFGLAKGAESGPKFLVEATTTGELVGTPRYMSPEQARGQKLDARTDIFSLGAVLYEMVAGQPAFLGSTTAEIFAALLNSAPQPPAAPGLDAIIQKALAKDRDARYQTMHDFAADLRDFRDQPARFVTAAADPKIGRLSRRALLGGAGALVAGTGLFLRFRSRSRHDASEDAAATSIVPLTSFAGFKDFGSFSPDGEQIVFSWNGGSGGSGGRQERDIYIQNIGNGDPVRLTFGRQDYTHPAWSPDGRFIAFCRMTDNRTPYMQFAISLIPASGGAERQIADGGEGVSWSPDGGTLAISGLPPESGGIVRVSIANGMRTRVTTSPASLDQLPVFSPDGKWIVFTRSLGPRARELFVIPAKGGPERQLTFEHQPTYGATWTADSKEIVFSSNRGGGGESLWRIPLAGGVPRRLTSMFDGAFYPSISRKGNRLIYTESFKDTNIYLREVAEPGGRSVVPHFGDARGLIVSSRRDDSPNISGTDERIAFVSKRTGNEEIWICDRDGRNPVQLTSFSGPDTGTPRWSPDGRRLAFDSSAAGNPNIYVISADRGSPRRLTSGPSGNYMPSWSVDGKRIYFKSDRSGTDQIWSIPVDGDGPATQITRGGACEAFSSPDGKLLYYTKRGWGAIWTVPAEGGSEKPIPELQGYDRIFRSWGVIRDGIYFISREEALRQTVRFFSFANRQVTSLLTLNREPIWDYPDIALSQDGRRLLTVGLDQEVNDLMLIQNFR